MRQWLAGHHRMEGMDWMGRQMDRILESFPDCVRLSPGNGNGNPGGDVCQGGEGTQPGLSLHHDRRHEP